MQLKRKECQLVWIFGALERLTSLGMISGFNYYITDPALFLEVDENRDLLFDDDSVINSIVDVVCRKKGNMTDVSDIKCVICLVKEYKNNRVELMKFALESVSDRS